MKKVLAGVALAAVMACGWASGAEAYQVIISSTYGVPADTAYDQTYTDVDHKVTYSETTYYDPNVYDPEANAPYVVTTIMGSGSVTNPLVDFASDPSNTFISGRYVATATLKDASFVRNETLNGITTTYSYNQDVVIYVALYYSTFGQSVEADGYLNGSPIETASVEITPVPLPASASLFGAALIGLIGLGCLKRRERATIAASLAG